MTTTRSLGGWIAACVIAETIGMTAAATAARLADAVPSAQLAGGLAIVVAGGLVEGAALGLLQGTWLQARYRAFNLLAWVGVTVLIAGVGWAGASLPSRLSASSSSTSDAGPEFWVIALGAVLIGVAMGAVLGAGQALVFTRVVRRPWRWIWVSIAAWTPTMVIIFVGATVPSASWSTAAVIATGAVTGACAGAVLGAVSGWLMPTIDGVRPPSA